MKHETLYNGKFIENCDLKHNIQKTMYKVVSDNAITGECNIVSGPDVLRHIQDGREFFTKNDTVNIVEIDNKVHKIQKDTVETAIDSIKKNVKLLLDDIQNVPSQRIIDADLMGSIGELNKTSNCGKILENLMKQQIHNFPNQDKAFLFTIAIRPITITETIAQLEKLLFKQLGYSINGYIIHDEPAVGKNKYEKDITISLKQRVGSGYIKNRKVIDIAMKYYNDCKGVMLTCSLIYK